MTEADKKAICEKLCGPIYSKDSGLHVAAPEPCPYLIDQWKNPKRRPLA